MKIKKQHKQLIENNKTFIQELAKVQDLYFDTLVEEMDLNERGRDWLFDYVYNDDRHKSFKSYLKAYNCEEELYYE